MPLTFVDDDQGYLQWLASHPRELVVNTYRRPNPSYLFLHRSSCHTISGTPARGKRWTTGDYAKFCSDDRADLEVWAQRQVGGMLKRCPFCQPK